ncbi:uncharacterized protein LOC142333878 [Lycorma delicatula]|uniref:uncharacterized protein LOC142333878 n=1 Tax=Lycorma delicatula TaxID=130591 RepID=UPI003F50D4C9
MALNLINFLVVIILLYIVIIFMFLNVEFATTAPVIGKDEHNCTPGELVWVNCNLCTCNLQGHANAVCARMWCQPTPKSQYESKIE